MHCCFYFLPSIFLSVFLPPVLPSIHHFFQLRASQMTDMTGTCCPMPQTLSRSNCCAWNWGRAAVLPPLVPTTEAFSLAWVIGRGRSEEWKPVKATSEMIIWENPFYFYQLWVKFMFLWIYNWGNHLIMDTGILWTIEPYRGKFLRKCYRIYVQKCPWLSLVIGLVIRNKETVACSWAMIMVSICSAVTTEWIVYKILDRHIHIICTCHHKEITSEGIFLFVTALYKNFKPMH